MLLLPRLKTWLPKMTFSGKLADPLQVREIQGPRRRSRDSDIKGKTLFRKFIVFPKI